MFTIIASPSKALLFGISWMIFILTVVIFYYFRSKQRKEKETLRMKLASDLHDDLGSILNSVSIYTDLALIKGDLIYLQKIRESTQEAIDGVRCMMWELDDTSTSFDYLVSKISGFASFLCEVKQIRFSVEMGRVNNYQLNKEEKRNLYMIIKEAINNSIKYSQGKEILLNIQLDHGKPVIVIKDDGIGFNKHCFIYGRGIRNMKARAESISYDITIESTSGTTIKLQKA